MSKLTTLGKIQIIREAQIVLGIPQNFEVKMPVGKYKVSYNAAAKVFVAEKEEKRIIRKNERILAKFIDADKD